MNLSKEIHAAFSDAIEAGNLVLVSSMLRQHPSLVDHSSWTPPPLHCATLWNQPEVVELLLDHGAQIEMLDPDRQTTPLRYAIMFCKVDVIPILLSRGAKTGPIVNGGTTALQLAKNAFAGEFKEFDDLPRTEDYKAVIETLSKAELSD